MFCHEFEENLSLYVDDALAPELKFACDAHLRECPLCRADLAEMRDMTGGLQMLAVNYSVPVNLQMSLRRAVAVEVAAQTQIEQTRIRVPAWQKFWNEVLQPRLMPYTTGALASFLLFVMIFAGLYNSMSTFREMGIQARKERQEREILLASLNEKPYEELNSLPAADYAVRRLPVSIDSPSLNPQSAFVALTASLSRGEMTGETICFVADVFSNGAVNITEMVDPPEEPAKLIELEKLMKYDAAFVPSTLDQRPEKVSVIFIISNVEVRENAATPKMGKKAASKKF